MGINLKNIRRILVSILWVLVAVGCITLLVSAMYNKENKKCRGIEIDITGVNDNYFIDKSDVYAIIKKHGGDTSITKSLSSIDLRKIEKELEKDIWIKNAELFFDNNNFLKVLVEEREPIARIFSNFGNSFYIDSSCKVLPLSAKFSARLPVFTGFVANEAVLSKVDSALLSSIKCISMKIYADTFLMAMIGQVDILPNGQFEMIPIIGKQIILFGDASNINSKFASLKLFYKKVMPLAGWNKYSKINVQYKNQVVASIRGKEDVLTDSLRTLALIQIIADDAAQRAGDSTQIFLPDAAKNNADTSMISQSVERDDQAIDVNLTLQKPTVIIPISKTDTNKIIKLTVVKPTIPKITVEKSTAQKPVVSKSLKPKH